MWGVVSMVGFTPSTMLITVSDSQAMGSTVGVSGTGTGATITV